MVHALLVLQQKHVSDRTVPQSLSGFSVWTSALSSHLSVAKSCADLAESIDQAIRTMRMTLEGGGKILICGNGGSAAQAQHMAAELVVRYVKDRRPIRALALTTDTSVITAAGNDLGYQEVFSRQVEAFARPDDTLIVISTSGKSANVNRACLKAKVLGCNVIALTGASGLFDHLPNLEIRVPSTNTARIQEMHTLIIHALCESLDG